jgi:hypothetical protein
MRPSPEAGSGAVVLSANSLLDVFLGRCLRYRCAGRAGSWRRMRRMNRGSLTAPLPRMEVVVDIEDHTRRCCRNASQRIGAIAERLDIIWRNCGAWSCAGPSMPVGLARTVGLRRCACLSFRLSLRRHDVTYVPFACCSRSVSWIMRGASRRSVPMHGSPTTSSPRQSPQGRRSQHQPNYLEK